MPTEAEFGDNMISLNGKVKHTTYGVGLVTDFQGKYMKIKFASAEKTFVYPDAFEKFLTLEDGTVSSDILADLEVSNKQKQDIINKKNEEKLLTMTHGIVIPGKEPLSFDTTENENRLKNTEPEEI